MTAMSLTKATKQDLFYLSCIAVLYFFHSFNYFGRLTKISAYLFFDLDNNSIVILYGFVT